jgi:AcrR family transcriptional regulator
VSIRQAGCSPATESLHTKWYEKGESVRRSRKREPDVTRDKLLRSAFTEIYRHGFQGASLDVILQKAGVTKGALYHHFPDKSALGYAVVDEVVTGLLLERWLGLLQRQSGDPVTALQHMLRERIAQLGGHEVELGCPLNNLGQEMSPLDRGFRRRIGATFETWIDGFARVLERGQKERTIRKDVDPRRIAAFLVASIEGSFGLAKSSGSEPLLRSNLETLSLLLESLRPPNRARGAASKRGKPGSKN